jgi:hypothetical protein
MSWPVHPLTLVWQWEKALASEWEKIDDVAHKMIATPEGRKGFLKMIEFSSPASKELGIQAAIDKEMLAIP